MPLPFSFLCEKFHIILIFPAPVWTILLESPSRTISPRLPDRYVPVLNSQSNADFPHQSCAWSQSHLPTTPNEMDFPPSKEKYLKSRLGWQTVPLPPPDHCAHNPYEPIVFLLLLYLRCLPEHILKRLF